MDVLQYNAERKQENRIHMTKDLTEGAITPQLIKFTIPLVFGNIFQLMYNSVDSIIVWQAGLPC